MKLLHQGYIEFLFHLRKGKQIAIQDLYQNNMNVHLIENEKFTEKFIEFLDRYYDEKMNVVYVYNNGNFFCDKQFKSVRYIKSLSEVDLTLVKNEGKLFVHAIYQKKMINFLIKNINRIKKSRLIIVAWGADIYDDRYVLADFKPHIRTRLKEWKKKRIIERADAFMTFACADINVINEYYGGKGKQFDCLYPSNANVDLLNRLKANSNKSDKTRILLGNSATETNRHIEMLDILKRFSNENIEIVCPLSYGNKEYGQYIKDYGLQVFGDKFIPIMEYMTSEEYCRLLSDVQIAIFNHNRQQGTGNIEILGYLGKKIFLCSDTTTWLHYVERDACRFFDTKSINELDFEKFKHWSSDDKSYNEKYFMRIWDDEYIKSLWDKVIYGEL